MEPRPLERLLSDAEIALLTRGMAKGKEKEYRVFYDRYAWRLFRKGFFLLHGDPETAADLVQETLLRVVKNIRPFETEKAFWNWLALILRNLVFDHLRKTRPISLASESLAQFPAKPDTLDEDILDLNAAMKHLTCDAQDLLLLKYQGGLTCRMIANQLGITEEAVETRLVRARGELRKVLIRNGEKYHE